MKELFLGEYIRQERLKQGVTQEQLCLCFLILLCIFLASLSQWLTSRKNKCY